MLIALITVMFAMVMFYMGIAPSHYISAFAFPAGLLFHEYFSPILSFLKKGMGKIVILAMTVMGVSGFILGMDGLVGSVYCRNLVCLAVLGIMVYFFTYFHPGNVFLEFLGKYSTEIYFYQFIYLSMDEISPYGWPLRLGLVMGLTLLTAVVMHPVNVWTRKKLTGASSGKQE